MNKLKSHKFANPLQKMISCNNSFSSPAVSPFFLTKSGSFRTSNVFSESARFKEGERRHGKRRRIRDGRGRATGTTVKRKLRQLGWVEGRGDHVLVLVVGSQREKGREMLLAACEWGQKRRGKAREKEPKPEGVFAPSARMSRGQMFDSVVHAMQSNGYLTGELNWKDKCVFLMH